MSMQLKILFGTHRVKQKRTPGKEKSNPKAIKRQTIQVRKSATGIGVGCLKQIGETLIILVIIIIAFIIILLIALNNAFK